MTAGECAPLKEIGEGAYSAEGTLRGVWLVGDIMEPWRLSRRCSVPPDGRKESDGYLDIVFSTLR